MKTSRLFQNWDITIKVALLALLTSVLSLTVAIILALKLYTTMERILLLPPNPTEQMTVERSNASKSYLESWALYFVTVIGSVTPSNAQSIADYVGRNVDQTLWHSIRSQILSVVEDPQYNRQGAFNMFIPKSVLYEPDTKKTFVDGTLSTLSYRNVNQAVAIQATYELMIEMRNGIPVVTHLNSYSGVPRTAMWLARNKPVLAQEQKERDRASAQALIRRDDLTAAQVEAEKVEADRVKATTAVTKPTEVAPPASTPQAPMAPAVATPTAP